jgi:hypothetical protein
MVRTLVLNSQNIVPNSNNSVLRYNFPTGGVYLQDEFIGVQQISLYNSVYNISASLNNNVFSYIWVDGTVNQVVMPSDGIHLSLQQINAYLQSVMVANDHYMLTSTNQFVYFLEIQVNQSRYAFQINAFALSASLATTNNWSQPTPTPSWQLPTNPIVPMLTVPATNFQDLIGFGAGNYPNTSITGSQPAQVQTPVVSSPYSVLSSSAPQIEPQTTYLGLCSLVNNKLVIPNQTIVAITPINIDFGGLFTIQYSAPAFNKVENGNYTGFEFRFVDSLGEQIAFQDPNMLIILILKNKFDGI